MPAFDETETEGIGHAFVHIEFDAFGAERASSA
jgi:hypothetical protein